MNAGGGEGDKSCVAEAGVDKLVHNCYITAHSAFTRKKENKPKAGYIQSKKTPLVQNSRNL